ncbi:MAG: DHH family phosphoesterase [Defluviitaleaceae bacterium]|nr:DHH family phosphoesterase [Defluviitaleaceae bacterium]
MKLKKLIDVIDRDRKLYIQMHRPPDPDCLASASVMSDMLRSEGLSPEIIYSGVIAKPETIELIDSLGIKLLRLDTESNKNLVKPADQIIVVDCQKENSNVAHLPGDYIACVDHHPELEKKEYLYSDIRPEFGACSSLIYEYAVEHGYELSPAQAALLIYGIRIDTDDLNRKKYLLDIDHFSALYKIANLEIISNINKNSIRPEDISTTITAYEHLTIINHVAYSYAGDDKAKESLAELSDRLISLADVGFVVVYSKCFNGYMFSVRSQLPAMHAGKIVKYAFSKSNGDGGGHWTMAGGVIPKVTFMDLIGDRAIMERIISIFNDSFENSDKQ